MFIAGGFQRNGRRVKWLPLGRPGKPMIEELQMMVEPRKVHQYLDIYNRIRNINHTSNTCIGIPVRSLQQGRLTSNWSNCLTMCNNWSMVDGIQIKQLY